MPIRNFVTAFAMLFLLAACNLMEQVDVIDERIEQWHSTYNSGDAQALYALTGEAYREATSPEQMDGLVVLVTERMGKVESSERTNTNINMDNGVTTTVVDLATVFEKGEATETMTFLGTGEETRLVGWNVDSPNFVDVPAEAVTEVPVDQ